MDDLKALFPLSLEQAAKKGFGSCSWSSSELCSLRPSRPNPRGRIRSHSSWRQGVAPGRLLEPKGHREALRLVCDKAWGPGATALDSSGLNAEARHSRILDVLGSVVLGLKFSESTPQQPARAADLGASLGSMLHKFKIGKAERSPPPAEAPLRSIAHG